MTATHTELIRLIPGCLRKQSPLNKHTHTHTHTKMLMLKLIYTEGMQVWGQELISSRSVYI